MPPAKIRVLVVDDSIVIRKILVDILSGDAEIEVVGQASNGKLALPKIRELKPDLVTLDIEMPEMDGLATLVEVRKFAPKLPVIMFSTLTEQGASATIDALSRGASDYATKPSNTGSFELSRERIRNDLIPKIKALCRKATALPQAALPAGARPSGVRLGLSRPLGAVELLVIGCSTGGPQALDRVLSGLSRETSVPVLIVQHMPATFTRMLAERLNGKCPLPVHEARDGEEVLPGQVLVAPGDYHMELVRTEGRLRVRLNQNPPENSVRPAVDVLFRSAAALHGRSTLAVVLTGMGQDGLRGARDIHAAGGTILAQDAATSVVWGMPGYVAQDGIAAAVLPLDEIAQEINTRLFVRRLPLKEKR
jgi:two-component system chemotaxis response regulator CheB